MIKIFLKNNLFKNKNTLLILLSIIAIVLVTMLFIDIFIDKDSNIAPVNNSVNDLHDQISDIAEEVNIVSPARSDSFRQDVPLNTFVPETDTVLSEEQKKEIALPSVVVPAAPGAESKFRSFKIIAEKDAFNPLKIIAKVGDTVNISFTATDKDYDIIFPSYNMKQTAAMGQTKVIQFYAHAEGDFTYYCSLCGGPERGPKGNIVIVAQ